ncbi:probable lysine-specific demethylase 4B [Acyrthosiphon pisum]|uniref:[Histone H3]-trimethyl-L-lysine(9) demethylase n=1 Tax=Acyrthosiphon pisum TaxID=7029 RepID=A0A8R2A6K1_ACYPI|nr:probable lysine-specific demethylase 4B [Acyrthosiphon pisum]|eukprot:XP_001948997.1 PREDICTED: probable lysine-specific demethylase 4B [Acyrthosiphon pisum]
MVCKHDERKPASMATGRYQPYNRQQLERINIFQLADDRQTTVGNTANKKNTMCSNNPQIMVFRPSLSEFQHFSRYIELMESKGAHKAGVAKIIPPSEWTPRIKSYDEDDIMSLKIPIPIYQDVQGNEGIYQQFRREKKTMTVRQFKNLAESEQYKTPEHTDYKDLERIYWENIVCHTPIYGADVTGSVTGKDVKAWNMNRLDTILDVMNDTTIEGVNTPYLYFGMWKSTFAWHTEDMDLYSLNYVHVGYPKTWYAIPPEYGEIFEKLLDQIYPAETSRCQAYVRHKTIVLSPDFLKKHSIPFNTITQEPGEFMVTFPFGYHAGFNQGYNIAEAINFATPRWVEYGKKTTYCQCFGDPIKFNMDIFIRRIQPDKYPLWLKRNNIGPHLEDHDKCDGPGERIVKKRKCRLNENHNDKILKLVLYRIHPYKIVNDLD